jgi:NFU1 iron-sulfur cluster scaffold homolog, mitochondrial
MIQIKDTQNPAILKFEFPDFITRNQSFEFKNIDEATISPLAQKLFHLPFVKTVFISANFIAIERYNIVSWDDVKDAVAEQMETFIADGGVIIHTDDTPKTKVAISIYSESTPNPNVMKFVANKILTPQMAEFKNIDDAQASPLAVLLFQHPAVKEVFMDENYISITKYESFEWLDLTPELRSKIQLFVTNGGVVMDVQALKKSPKQAQQEVAHFENLDTTSQQIINILEEYVKPAVQADGGNILFDSYLPEEKRVKVILQGACSGCPSSTFTLKNGIETMLKQMLNDQDLVVEALNG